MTKVRYTGKQDANAILPLSVKWPKCLSGFRSYKAVCIDLKCKTSSYPEMLGSSHRFCCATNVRSKNRLHTQSSIDQGGVLSNKHVEMSKQTCWDNTIISHHFRTCSRVMSLLPFPPLSSFSHFIEHRCRFVFNHGGGGLIIVMGEAVGEGMPTPTVWFFFLQRNQPTSLLLSTMFMHLLSLILFIIINRPNEILVRILKIENDFCPNYTRFLPDFRPISARIFTLANF